MSRHPYDYDLIVIGSGAGGSVAADIVARDGKRVAVVESDELGGECPNWGCVPTKSMLHAANIYDAAKRAQPYGLRPVTLGFNYPSIKAWKELAVKRAGASDNEAHYHKHGIGLYKGMARFISPHEITVNRRHISAAHFLIATGSHWAVPDVIGINEISYLTARSALELSKPPKSVFIIGGGPVACEFTELFSVFGSKVYTAEFQPRLLAREDEEVSPIIESQFKSRGVQVLTSTKVLSVAREGLMVRVSYQRGGARHSAKVDQVLVAAGKLANTDLGLENAGVEYVPRSVNVNDFLQTSARHIYAAGDVLGRYMFTHTGVYESRVVAHNILHPRKRIAADYHAVPRVTFITPEVASVGLSEADCMRRDIPIRKAVAPLSIIGRSNVNDWREGFAKVITDKNGTLIGGTIVSPHAGEAIHELTLAVNHRMNASMIANTLHSFPSWSEALRVACGKI